MSKIILGFEERYKDIGFQVCNYFLGKGEEVAAMKIPEKIKSAGFFLEPDCVTIIK
jgi:hypothetical protein